MAIVYTDKAQHILQEDDNLRTLCGLRFHGQWTPDNGGLIDMPACKPCAATQIMLDIQIDEWANGETF